VLDTLFARAVEHFSLTCGLVMAGSGASQPPCQARIFNHPKSGGNCRLIRVEHPPERQIGSNKNQYQRFLCLNCDTLIKTEESLDVPAGCVLCLPYREKGIKTRKIEGKDCKVFFTLEGRDAEDVFHERREAKKEGSERDP